MGKRTGRYLRISEDREGLELGTTRQDEDTLALCERLGDEVVDTYRDNDISASTRSKKRRPEYERLLADARAGRIERVVAYTSGRLTRRPREHEDLIELAEEHGVEFVYVASPSFDLATASGRRIARILAANDAGEPEDTSERLVRQRAQAAATGQRHGGRRPYGFEPDGLTVRQAEAAVIAEMTERTLAGEPLRALASDLNRRGATTSTGAAWSNVSLREVLLRARNAGLREHRGQVVATAVWPAVVAPDTWRALCALLTSPGRRLSTSTALRWLGSGLYLCGLCADETTVLSGTTHNRHAKTYKPAYRCRRSGHLIRIADPVDTMVSGLVVKRLSRKDAVLLLDDGREDIGPLHLRLTEIRALLDEQAVLHAQRIIDGAQLAAGTRVLRTEADGVKARIAAVSSRSVLADLVGASDVLAAWKATPVARQRAVVDDLMAVTILPAGRRGRQPDHSYFDPESIQIDWKK